MREMKDSEIEWVGYIDSRVQMTPIKYLLEAGKNAVKVGPFGSQLSGTDFQNEETGYWVYNQRSVIDKNVNDGTAFITEEKYNSMKGFHVKSGDILITTRGTIGKIFRLPAGTNKGILHPCIIRFRLDDNAYDYALLEMIFNESDMVSRQLLYESNSTTIEVIYSETLRNIKVPVWPMEMQKQISAFLQEKCAEIDALSTDIQSEIDTLEAYKRSVITEAVTKGLDKNVPMKESGMPWIGVVPKHWRVEKVKYHLQRNEPRNPGNQQVLSVYREYGVIPKDSRDDNHNVTSEDTSKYKYVRPGDLAINKMKAWQGSMGVSEYEGVVSPAYFIYRFVDNELMPKYLHYLFRTCYKDEFRRISGGIREGQWDLSPEAFNNTMLLLPPVNEQQSIIALVNQKTEEIEGLIAGKQEQLSILADYKKSIIYEYVTGKKEVGI